MFSYVGMKCACIANYSHGVVLQSFFVAEVFSKNMSGHLSSYIAIDTGPTVRWARSQALLQLKLTVKRICWKTIYSVLNLKINLV